jgi:hypothetical protein
MNLFRIDQSFGALNIIDYYDDGMAVIKLLNGEHDTTKIMA